MLIALKCGYAVADKNDRCCFVISDVLYQPMKVSAFLYPETRVPSQVNVSSIRFPTIEEDTRPGFLGRAVLHISWKRPEGQLYNYIKVMYPNTFCVKMCYTKDRKNKCHM